MENEKEKYDMKSSTTAMASTTSLVSEKGVRVYKWRWVVLCIFVLYSMTNSFQWIQYSIIADVIIKYYQVEQIFVDWCSMVYMIFYIVLIVPGSWAVDKFGLRWCVIIGTVVNCIGAWIKVFSAQRHLFYVSFIGQCFSAASQVFVLSIPARLAAVWFGPDQVSSACSIGVFGNQLGVALGFLFPPILVPNSENMDDIGTHLADMFYIVGGVTTVIVILTIVFFRNAPPTPPSPAQAAVIEMSANDFKGSIVRLLKNLSYDLLLLSYGMNIGVYYALSTLLNQIILNYYPGSQEDAGRIGLTVVVMGMIGAFAAGFVLDKTHWFKQTTLFLYVFSFVGLLIFSFALGWGYIAVVYVIAAIFGFFMTGYLPVGFELAAELTYPEPEATSAGILNGVVQIFGIIFTSFYSWLFTSYGVFWANIAMVVALFVGSIITACIKSDLRRQAAMIVKREDKEVTSVAALP